MKNKDYLKEFVIRYGDLEAGIHQYDFSIEDSFFDYFEYSEVKKGKLEMLIILEKLDNMLSFDFLINGNIETECDRCLEKLILPIQTKERLIARFGEHYSEEDDDLIIIPKDETTIDLSQYIFEFISLQLPIQKVHPDDEKGNISCDSEIIKLLERHISQETDKRWDILKNIQNNENNNNN